MTPRTVPPNLASRGTDTSATVMRLRNQAAAPELDFRDMLPQFQSRSLEATGAVTH